jgi:hypothetical protein
VEREASRSGRRHRRRHGAVSGRLVVGLCVMAFGLIFTLDSLGMVDAERFVNWWPLVLIAVGLVRILQPAGAPGRGFGWVLALLGGALLLDTLDLWDLDWGLVFPLVMVAIGGVMVSRAVLGRRAPPAAAVGGGEAGVPGAGASSVSAFALFGTVVRRPTTRSFRGGDLGAVFGACDLDLRGAELAPEGAVLEVFALFGGIDVRVPPGWAIEVTGTPILGAFEDNSGAGGAADGPRLTVQGLAIFGGVEVKS